MKTFFAFSSGLLLAVTVFLTYAQFYSEPAETMSNSQKIEQIVEMLDLNPKLTEKVTQAVQDEKVTDEEFFAIEKSHASFMKILKNYPDLEVKKTNQDTVDALKERLYEINYGVSIDLDDIGLPKSRIKVEAKLEPKPDTETETSKTDDEDSEENDEENDT